MRAVDSSAADFSHLASVLVKCDQDALEKSSLAHLLAETKNQWRHSVLSAADVFIAREKGAE